MRRRMFLGADKFLFQKAAQHRKQPTVAEEILWNYLRTKPFGLKFRRQHPFSSYILDFYCHKLKLAIEVDGSIHDLEEIKQNDVLRQRQLEKEGLTFLRFTNEEIRIRSEDMIQKMEAYLIGKIETSKDSST